MDAQAYPIVSQTDGLLLEHRCPTYDLGIGTNELRPGASAGVLMLFSSASPEISGVLYIDGFLDSFNVDVPLAIPIG